MSTRTERFQRKSAPKNDASAKPAEQEEEEIVKFSPEEEAVHPPHHNAHTPELTQYTQALLEESNTTKTQANTRFASSEYTEAIDLYNTAISTCPNYLDYEVAVLRSNIAACHLKLEDWKLAVEEATKALDGLDKLQGWGKFEKKTGEEEGDVKSEHGEGKDSDEEEEADEEIISEGATKAENTGEKGKRESDVDRIRAKALMRRARAKSELGGWSSLAGAEEGTALTIPTSVVLLLIFIRLQSTFKDEEPLHGRYEDCPKTTHTTTTKDKSSSRKGNGRYDGETEIIGKRDLEAFWVIN